MLGAEGCDEFAFGGAAVDADDLGAVGEAVLDWNFRKIKSISINICQPCFLLGVERLGEVKLLCFYFVCV